MSFQKSDVRGKEVKRQNWTNEFGEKASLLQSKGQQKDWSTFGQPNEGFWNWGPLEETWN